MSCTCNQSINCDPCAFCTPPGVTCLTTCAPIDPCKEKIDIDCVIYSGEDHPCSDIANGQPISQIMLQALSLIFPLEECCYFEATAVAILPAPQQYTFCFSSTERDGNCGRACECDNTSVSGTVVYSLDNPLVPGSLLYSNSTLSALAPAGWYSANENCTVVSGGASSIIPGVSGAVQSISPCVTPTTTPAPTITIAPCYCYTVTILSTNTIAYINCEGDEVTSPSYETDDVIELCAEYVIPDANYIITPPTQYCGDRINCPTTTTTTTAPPTTTTTTLPPCNCITFTNFSNNPGIISWRNCLGQMQNETMPPAPDGSNQIFAIVNKCGSSAASSDLKIDISVVAPCSGTGLSAVCNVSSTTTKPCSQFILYCCKNDTGTPIVIQPCYPNVLVPFVVGNVYIDELSRYWVVMGTTGTPTITTGIPLSFAFLASYGSASLALAACQESSVNQTALCPGITTTLAPATAYSLSYNVTDCGGACGANSPTTYYSRCATLSSGGTCRLFTDLACTTPVSISGYFSNGTTCYSVISSGYVSSISLCSNYTTTTTIAPTTTVDTKRITVNNQLLTNYGNIRITNVGSFLNGGIQPIPTATWLSGPALNPGNTAIASYTLLGSFQQFAVSLTPTQIGGTNYTVYLHLYVNGSLIETILVPYSATAQTVAFASRTYTTGETIIINLNRTP